MLILENLCKEYGARTLFKNVQFNLPKGERIALIGANGAGKTTLLRILTGELEPTLGRVGKPKDAVLGYLPQEPNPNPKPTIVAEVVSGATRLGTMQARMDQLLKRYEENHEENLLNEFSRLEDQFRSLGGYGMEARAKDILNGLGFTAEQLDASPLTLSGGWRMRLELAKIFLNDPDILLLDEPTNHLDLPSLIWVEDYLMHYDGTLIFVSHDRPLLNRLSTFIMELANGKLNFYRGSFDEYLDHKELLAEQNAAAREQLKRKQEHLAGFVERFGAKASKARQAQSKMKQLTKLRALEESIPEEEAAKSISLRLPKPPPCARVVLKVSDMSIGYGSKTLSASISFQIERGMKVAIIGANGIGKSTLLKTLVQRIPPLAGSIELGDRVDLSYFAQDQMEDLDEDETVLASVASVNYEVGEKGARSLLGNLLFRGDDVFKKVGVLSGGEKNRVGLARVLISQTNFLLLDEPTNHLDMSSVGVLSMALAEYEGTLAFVSHDRDFIDDVCTHVLVMLKDGRNALFEGKLEDYKRMADVSGFPYILGTELEPKKKDQPAKKEAPKPEKIAAPNKVREHKDLQRKLSQLEKNLETIRAQIAKVDVALGEVDPRDHARLHELMEEREQAAAKLSSLEDEWLQLTEQMES